MTPPFGLTSTRARMFSELRRNAGRLRKSQSLVRACGRRTGALQPGLERLAGNSLVGFDVLFSRAGHDIVGDGRRRRSAIPAGGRGPVTHVLLVEAGLPAARLVLV